MRTDVLPEHPSNISHQQADSCDLPKMTLLTVSALLGASLNLLQPTAAKVNTCTNQGPPRPCGSAQDGISISSLAPGLCHFGSILNIMCVGCVCVFGGEEWEGGEDSVWATIVWQNYNKNKTRRMAVSVSLIKTHCFSHPSTHPSVRPSVRLSTHPSIHPSLPPSTAPVNPLSVHSSTYPSVQPFHLSI